MDRDVNLVRLNPLRPTLAFSPPSSFSQWKMQKGGENGIKDGEDLIFLQSKMEFLGVERETEGGEKERAEKKTMSTQCINAVSLNFRLQ